MQHMLQYAMENTMLFKYDKTYWCSSYDIARGQKLLLKPWFSKGL